MRRYEITMTGIHPLIMHWDNIEWADQLSAWRLRPENKKTSVAGDDRSPPFSWIGCVYNDGERICIPHDNLRSCLMAAGTKVPKKRNGSYKSEAAAGINIDTLYVPLLVNGKELPFAGVEKLNDPAISFSQHIESVRKMGFDLMVKRATVGQSKHVRVRPIFKNWSLSFVADITEDTLTETVMEDILDIAGRMVGIGDWRPGSKKSPGPYGKFTATMKKVTS